MLSAAMPNELRLVAAPITGDPAFGIPVEALTDIVPVPIAGELASAPLLAFH
jgi:hypothetical protein